MVLGETEVAQTVEPVKLPPEEEKPKDWEQELMSTCFQKHFGIRRNNCIVYHYPYLTCAENEEDTIVDGPTGPTGYVDVYCTSHGRAPRKCPQCASEIYTTVDAGKVESTVDACYSKKEKSHPLYKEYAAYLEKVQQKTEAIEKCVYEVIGQKRSQAAVMKPKTSAASTNPRKTRPTKG
ncbi:uncharacterized protein ISCGN_011706 [Ixodes scapularis]